MQTQTSGNVNDAEYAAFLLKLSHHYREIAREHPVFRTDAPNLWANYLGGFSDVERQHHNCSACHHFIHRYGGLVVIDPGTGLAHSAMWSKAVEEAAPENYKGIVRFLRERVEASKIISPFYSPNLQLGTPRTGEWVHMWASNPKPHTDLTMTAGQLMAERRNDYVLLRKALEKYDIETARQAVKVLDTEAVYRSDRFLGVAKFFLSLHELAGKVSAKQYNNTIWLAVAKHGSAFARVGNSMIGTLLDDIQAGMQFDDIMKRFNAKMKTYRTSSAAPKAGTIQQAEKLFAQLGLAPALQRRYARVDDIRAGDVLWMPRGKAADEIAKRGSVFGHLQAADAPPAVADLSVPPKAITWEKFSEKVLPEALKIEAVIPPTSNRFMALTTAVHSDAPPILQWDVEGFDRNPFSWYYASGVDVQIKQRVEAAGGMYSGVDIRASLVWEGFNDLDLHCLTPLGHRIWFNQKNDHTGGELDVDANANCAFNVTDKPVENIRWPQGYARAGNYQFFVNHYKTHHRESAITPFRVEIEINGEVYVYGGETRRAGETVTVANFVYNRNGPVSGLHHNVRRADPAPTEWNVTPGTLVPVTAIVPSPNLWGPHKVEHAGRHAFFLLEGCRDTSKGVGRGFFSEQVRSDLHSVRKVLDAHLRGAEIEGADTASACGIGISSQGTGDLMVRVTTKNGQMLYKIDRWD